VRSGDHGNSHSLSHPQIIGDKNGYASSEAANKTLGDAKAECKGSVNAQTESKFKAAQTEADKVGDIEGLSDEQIKQLRGY